MQIKSYDSSHLDAIVRLSLRAWEPVFASLQNAFNPNVYQTFYPEHWQVSQQKAVEDICADDNAQIWVAIVADSTANHPTANHPTANQGTETIAGFIAVKLHPDDRMGEIYMIAVDPDFQKCGIGSALVEFSLTQIQAAGMAIAMVETGGDPGHAPARQTYEKAGFEHFPVARYFKALSTCP